MNILEKIVAFKKKEIQTIKQQTKTNKLEKNPLFERKTLSISKFLKNKSGVIAEFKRKSPSKGFINANANVEEVVKIYEENNASGVSVLTDFEFFNGSLDDFQKARKICNIPMLRKDFIIDEYQILEAKAYGADVILLISAILSKEEIKQFASLAHSLGLEVLLEIHDENELCEDKNINLIGVNNRNLKTFKTDINTSFKLADKISNDFIKVSESGISKTESIKELKKYGFEGFLIGENFMGSKDIKKAVFNFLKEIS